MRRSTLCLVPIFVGIYATCKVDQAMEREEIVPDVIPVAPKGFLCVKYPSGAKAELGNELTPTLVKDQPTVSWKTKPHSFYTLCLSDPDVPNRTAPKEGDHEFRHWLVGNIPMGDINKGETLTEYVGSATPPKTGIHRYVFLVYKQPSRLDFSDEPRVSNRTAETRLQFSIHKFALKYNLGTPVAGNFYLAQYDDYVPIIFEQLGMNISDVNN